MVPCLAAGLRRLAAAAVLAVAAGTAAANPLSDGMDAYDRGDFPQALKAFGIAAAAGSAAAPFYLGLMHAKGHGVARDPVAALMYLELAAARGFAMAPRSRDDLAAAMTPDRRAEAARRARDWHPAGPPGD